VSAAEELPPLADDLEAVGPRGKVCQTRLVLEHYEGTPDFDRIRRALNNPKLSLKGQARALQARGFTISDQSIGNHRRGECKCPEEYR
jgi:hypothetical protein